jgi:uncharacterized protein YeaO (DUF488 family)
MTKQRNVRAQRIYEDPTPQDGRRVLVDRLWPRGISKQAANLDDWAKAVAPSTELRRWYGHDPAKFAEFKRRYAAELSDDEHADAWDQLVDAAGAGPVTLLTATKDLDHSEAAVLAEWLATGRVPDREQATDR